MDVTKHRPELYPGLIHKHQWTAVSAVQGTPVNVPLVVAFVVGSFSSEKSPLGDAGLWLPLAILCCLSIWTLARTGRTHIARPVWSGLLVGAAIVFSAMLGVISTGDAYSAGYGFSMLAVWAMVAYLTVQLTLRSVIRSFAISGVVVVWFFAATSYDALLLSLALSTGELAGVVRYGGPFEVHPNLMGHIMGAYAGVLFWQGSGARRLRRPIYLVSAAVALLMCLAASSRGGLFASIGAVAAAYLITAMRERRRFFWLAITTLTSAYTVLVYAPGTWDMLVAALGFDNMDRGVGSGLSGRTELWALAVEQFGTSNAPLAWGAGLRNAWQTANVVDNSYLVILMETGAAGLILWVGRVLLIFWRSAYASLRHFSPFEITIASHLLFSLAEGIVNRQFLAIGNPASLLTLMIVVMYVRSSDGPPVFSFRHTQSPVSPRRSHSTASI